MLLFIDAGRRRKKKKKKNREGRVLKNFDVELC